MYSGDRKHPLIQEFINDKLANKKEVSHKYDAKNQESKTSAPLCLCSFFRMLYSKQRTVKTVSCYKQNKQTRYQITPG